MCRTGGRRCPSSRRQGADLAAYNKHRREMYAAKKEHNEQLADAKEKMFIRNEDIHQIDNTMTAKQIEKALNGASPKQLVYGKASEETEITEKHAEYQLTVNKLMSFFKDDDGNPTSPEDTAGYRSDKWKEDLGEIDDDGNPEFKFIGKGVDKLVYLHKKTGLVYKVIAAEGDDNKKKEFYDAYIKSEQILVANIDESAMEDSQARYATNYYMTSANGFPVIAQEYLDPKEYEPHSSFDDMVLHQTLKELGFVDMHDGNVRKHRKTGDVVLFDCLVIGFLREPKDLVEGMKVKGFDL